MAEHQIKSFKNPDELDKKRGKQGFTHVSDLYGRQFIEAKLQNCIISHNNIAFAHKNKSLTTQQVQKYINLMNIKIQEVFVKIKSFEGIHYKYHNIG